MGWSIYTENSIEILFRPFSDDFTGSVELSCEVFRGSNDESGAGPGSSLGTGTYTATWRADSCDTSACVNNAECIEPFGCVCDDGWQNPPECKDPKLVFS